MHADALQRIEQKVRVNLAVECKKLRMLPGDIHLLLLQPILIHRLNQFVGPVHHTVIILHQRTDLILSPNTRNGYQTILIHTLKGLPQFPDSRGQRPVDCHHEGQRKYRIDQHKKQNQGRVLQHAVHNICLRFQCINLQCLSVNSHFLLIPHLILIDKRKEIHSGTAAFSIIGIQYFTVTAYVDW